MAKKYTIELDSREAVVVRVALRREMERRESVRRPNPAWRDVHDCAQSVLVKLGDRANVTEVAPTPHGLCGNRADHEPHLYKSTSLGVFYCHADQAKRLPYALERKHR